MLDSIKYMSNVLYEKYKNSGDKELVNFLRYDIPDILAEIDSMEDIQKELDDLSRTVMILEDDYGSLSDDVNDLRDDVTDIIETLEGKND